MDTATPSPIAIVGLAMRLPGDLQQPHDLWQALREGRDLVGSIDPARWATRELQHPSRAEPGRSITFSAGVLSDIESFDASFFGISPREAQLLDPQQRLLLEMAWETLEDAGIPPTQVAGSDCAVYLGISGLDYGMRLFGDMAVMGAHTMTGNTMSVAANRLSYVFDLHGPSLAVDTACSSSLVALHHGCEALRHGQAGMALVGGINVLLHPYPFVGFTKASMLSANGRCRPFAAGADGYVRAEGGGLLLLKPLQQALRDGDRIHGVIRASGVNTDGARKSGLTIPSGQAQAELMQQVLGAAGLQAQDIDYLEAHGTGTRIGDPIEAGAIGRVYGQPRDGAPLPIGSIKSNLGHLEPASGMAGLFKALLVLQHAEVPPTRVQGELNPDIDFDTLGLQVVREAAPLAPAQRPLRAAVNSFGFGGVNAHVILEQPPSAAPRAMPAFDAAAPAAAPLLLSAQDAGALRALARAYLPLLEDPARRAEVAQAAWRQRAWLGERLALADAGDAQALQALRDFAEGGEADTARLWQEQALPDLEGGHARVAWIYSGNGAQWVGMGRRLRQQSALFDSTLRDTAARIAAHGGPDVLAALDDDQAQAMDDTAVAQPALFALQVATTSVLRSRGLRADAAMGHSVGEIAAAWAMGVLDLDSACRVIVARSAAQATTRGAGRMAAVGLGAQALQQRLQALGLEGQVAIAADNSPRNSTVSGTPQALQQLHEGLRADATAWRELGLDYAFHSPAMDPIREPLLHSLQGLQPAPGQGRVFSSVTGAELAGSAFDADYWWHNIRDCVQFAPALRAMREAGVRLFVEIGPHAILQRYLAETLDGVLPQARALACAPRRDDTLARLHECVLRAAMLGAEVDAAAWFAQDLPRRVALPSYPWQRQRHWYPRSSESRSALERRAVHPLLGWRLDDHPAGWENHLDPRTQTWLAGHKVGGAMVLPAAAYVEMALAASKEHFGSESAGHVLEGLDIVAPVVFDGEHARTLRLLFDAQSLRFRIEGRPRLSEDAWTLHAQGRLLGAVPGGESRQPLLAQQPAATRLDAQRHYALCEALGLDYSGAFRAIQGIEVAARSISATLRPDDACDPAWLLPPPALDQGFQSVLGWLGALRQGPAEDDAMGYLPVGIGRLDYWALPAADDAPAQPVRSVRVSLVRSSPRSVLVDLELLDAAGTVLARLRDCRFRAAALVAQARAVSTWALLPQLQPLPPSPEAAARGGLPEAAALLQRLQQQAVDTEQAAVHARYLEQAAPLLELLPLAFGRDALLAQLPPGSTVEDSRVAQWRQAHPLLQWLLDQMEQQGLLLQGAQGWELHDDPQLPAAADIWNAALESCPQAAPELLQLGLAGSALPALLAGAADAPAADLSALLRAPAYRMADAQALRALHALLGDWPRGRRLRVLELCSTDDSLFSPASAWLEGLAHPRPQDVDWVLGCADADALAQLQAAHADDARLRALLLDPNEFELPDLADEAPFDIVLVRQVLHRSSKPQRALRALAARMHSDAWLLLAERRPDHAAHLGFGLRRDWWHVTDGRAEGALLPDATWCDWLAEHGWRDTAILPAASSEPAALLGGFVLLARAPRQALLQQQAATPVDWVLHLQHPAWQATAERLAERLRAAGHGVRLASADDGAGAGSPQRHVLFVGSAPRSGAQPTPADAAEVARQAEALRGSLLELAASPEGRRVHLVLRGGALVDDAQATAADPAAAALWGLARVAMNECHPLALQLIDLDAASPDEGAERLLQELLHGDDEQEVLLGAAHGAPLRQVPRVRPLPLEAQQHDAQAWRLDFRLAGQLRNLQWQAVPRREPGPGEVEIRAMAAGLNFRDVMYAMGLLADEAVEQGFAGASLGLEVAGRVLRCGPGVEHLRPGDEVLAFAGASFASHVVVPARAVARKPEHWSFAEAATVPTVFFTVWYALKHLARLQPGERVLVHGAAGGVGLAAIQVARLLGAEVYASAGNPAKRAFVRMLGVQHVVDSRSLDFDRAVLRASDGQGVDVVLNSLAGEAIARNLACLKPFGRFIELGKRDFYENTPVGLRPFRNNLSYFGVDADQLMSLRPELAAEVFAEAMQCFADGKLHPLPHRLFEPDQVVDAFRHMQQARQIGKVVVELERRPRHIQPAQRPRLQLRADASYLVSGGLSGFGLASARWLADRGARHLVLLGRRGEQTPGLQQPLQELRARGVQVQVHACDISDRQALRQVFEQMRAGMPELRGVLHAAMVLDDALMSGLDEQRLRRVLQPKLDGAWNLHQATAGLPLDLFVLFSSATTMLGNPGQANYVAANASLEALARLRRRQGLAGCAVAWGPIADVGVLTTNEVARENLQARLGAAPIESAAALDRLEALMLQQVAGAAVMNLDWPSLQRLLPGAGARRFDTLRGAGGDAREDDEDDLRQRLAALCADEARALVQQMLCREVAEILRLPADKVGPAQSVFDLGMDSLMAVELGLALERRFGIRVPPMMLNENPSIERIAERLLAQLGPQPGEEAADSTRDMVRSVLSQHAENTALQQVDELAQQVRQAAEGGTQLIA